MFYYSIYIKEKKRLSINILLHYKMEFKNIIIEYNPIDVTYKTSEKIDIDLLSNEIVKHKAINKQNHETFLNKLKEERQNYINIILDNYYNIVTDTELIKNKLININVKNAWSCCLLSDDTYTNQEGITRVCREELIHKPLNIFNNNNKYKDENRSIYQILLDKLPNDDYTISYYYDSNKFFKIDIDKKNHKYYYWEIMKFICCGYPFERKGSYHTHSIDLYLNPK